MLILEEIYKNIIKLIVSDQTINKFHGDIQKIQKDRMEFLVKRTSAKQTTLNKIIEKHFY